MGVYDDYDNVVNDGDDADVNDGDDGMSTSHVCTCLQMR